MTSLSRYIHFINIIQGDITREKTDAIVNAANPGLLGGGGVDGAIHRAAGPNLLKECKTLGGCNHGEARITGGYNLSAQFVIHTPGPIYKNGKHGEAKILQSSYENSLKLAKDNNLKSISFPAISTGVYGFPKDEACKIALMTTLNFLASTGYSLDVNFVLFDKENYNIYNNYLKEIQNNELS